MTASTQVSLEGAVAIAVGIGTLLFMAGRVIRALYKLTSTITENIAEVNRVKTDVAARHLENSNNLKELSRDMREIRASVDSLRNSNDRAHEELRRKIDEIDQQTNHTH